MQTILKFIRNADKQIKHRSTLQVLTTEHNNSIKKNKFKNFFQYM